MKTADFKSWSFLDLSPLPQPPPSATILKKYPTFGSPKNSFKKLPIESVSPKTFPGTNLGLARDQNQRNSPQAIKSGLELNRIFFVVALFALKDDSQGTFTTRRNPYGHKQAKNADFKMW